MLQRALALTCLVALVCLGAGSRSAQAEDPAAQKYSAAELKELVGPVALYPDVVLSSMLPASTFPVEVKAAAEYVTAQGGRVDSVPTDKNWDASVGAMLQFPDVLIWMKDNPVWVEQMGFAVAVQQSEVLAAVQLFRADAEKVGNLTSNEYQTINIVEADDASSQVIIIEPTNPQVVYVPTYEPVAVMSPGYVGYGWGWGFAAGVVGGVWAANALGWGNWNNGGGSININNGNINTGNINGGNINGGNNLGPNRGSGWNASNRPSQRPGGGVQRPSQLPAKRPGAGAGQGVGGGGVRPPSRPSRPSTAPGAGASRPNPAPSLPGAGAGNRPGAGAGAGAGARPGPGAGAGSRPSPGAGQRPSTRPSNGFSGGSSGAQTRAQSHRGGSSMRSSGGGSGGGSFKGQSRGGGGGRSGGGGGRGGGGGGRRR